MTLTKASTRGKPDALYPFDGLLVTMHRSPAGIAWRWRTPPTAWSRPQGSTSITSAPRGPGKRGLTGP